MLHYAASSKAAAKPIEEVSLADIGLTASDAGADSSMSRVRRMYVPAKGRAQMIEGTVAEQAARLIQIINEFKGA